MKRNWKNNVRFIVEMFFVFTMGIILGFMAFLLILNLLWII